MARKQLSGAQKRKINREKARAAGFIMPRAPTLKDLSSLTGTMRESAQNYIHWRKGRLSHQDYLISVKGLEAHKGVLTALEMEKQTQATEKLSRDLEALRAGESEQFARVEFQPQPHDAAAPIVGEFIPADRSKQEDEP